MDFDWVVFDLNGTVLDPAGISAGLPAPLNTERTGLELLDDTVQQAMVDTAIGRYRPFSVYLRAAVVRRLALAGLAEADSAADDAVAAAARLAVFPEVPAALRLLAASGARIAAITNSPTATAESNLREAGVRDLFSAVVGSDHARAYKPAPVVYRTGLDVIGVRPERACMVAAHAWDLHGAAAAGMHTAWIDRKERVRLDSLAVPDFSGSDVEQVCLRLLGA